MSGRFLTRLRIEDGEGENATCTLLADLVYASEVINALVIVPKGFETDLASVPRLPLVFLVAGAVGNEAAVVHDFLYASCPCTRKQADAVFREALLASGVSAWRAWVMWCGVRAGGARHWGSPSVERTA